MSVIRFDRYRDKENVPDNLVVMHGNERKSADKVSIIPEGADKPGFAVLANAWRLTSKIAGISSGISARIKKESIVYDGTPQ